MKPSAAAFIHSKEIQQYQYPPESPFKTQRASMTKDILLQNGLYTNDKDRFEEPPRKAKDEEILLFHTKPYLEALRRVSAGNMTAQDLFMGLGTGDCPIFSDLYNYASLAAGGTIRAAELILENRAQVAFNPSGGYHHAYSSEAGGFCYINDVAIACTILKNAGKKVFCLDIDAHHGNGTQKAFIDDPAVFTLSMHESGNTLFPGSGFENEIGTGKGKGFCTNIPVPAGCDDDLYLLAYRSIVPKLLEKFKPDVLVLEIGMDILCGDPLTNLKMTNNVLTDILPQLRDLGIPILATGGGGYTPSDTARGWALSWSILCDIEPDNPMSLGMGGVFLGSSEWDAGLKDMHYYTPAPEKEQLFDTINKTVELVKKNIFPIHGIAD